jgi:hypothetical protein
VTTSDKESREITLEKVKNGEEYIIPQSERLYTVRPRYFKDKKSRGRVATLRIKKRGVAYAPNSSAAAALAERVRGKLIGKDGERTEGLTEFLVQTMQVGFNEKVQVMQTFGDAETVYYFGRTPTTLSITGVLLDDLDNDWFVRFITAYNSFLRGTQLAKNFELVELSTNNATFTGTFMNLQFNQNSQNDAYIPFSCTLLIKSFEYHSNYQFDDELADDVEYIDLNSKEFKVRPTKTKEEINNLLRRTRLRGNQSDNDPIPSGIYAREAVSSSNKTLGGIADFADGLSIKINSFADALGKGTESLLDPINKVIGSVQDISSAAYSVVGAINKTVDSVLDPIAATVSNFQTTRSQLKNLQGTIASLPENLSEKISRFARAGGISNPAFLKSPSANINSSEALAAMKGSNKRTQKSAGLVGPTTSANSNADQVARLQ